MIGHPSNETPGGDGASKPPPAVTFSATAFGAAAGADGGGFASFGGDDGAQFGSAGGGFGGGFGAGAGASATVLVFGAGNGDAVAPVFGSGSNNTDAAAAAASPPQKHMASPASSSCSDDDDDDEYYGPEEEAAEKERHRVGCRLHGTSGPSCPACEIADDDRRNFGFYESGRKSIDDPYYLSSNTSIRHFVVHENDADKMSSADDPYCGGFDCCGTVLRAKLHRRETKTRRAPHEEWLIRRSELCWDEVDNYNDQLEKGDAFFWLHGREKTVSGKVVWTQCEACHRLDDAFRKRVLRKGTVCSKKTKIKQANKKANQKKKRKRSAADEEISRRRKDKHAKADPELDALGKLTVPELKQRCKELGLKRGGSKSELMLRLLGHA